jgi:hypothetical protein
MNHLRTLLSLWWTAPLTPTGHAAMPRVPVQSRFLVLLRRNTVACVGRFLPNLLMDPSDTGRVDVLQDLHKQGKPVSKVHVTVKSVETANRMMQRERGLDRSKMTGWVTVKPATPSPVAIAKAGERALQTLKK